MDHRWQLLSKLLMMEYDEQCEVPGARWFYCALQNVEVITQDGYWQAFELIECVAALIFSLLTLSISSWQDEALDFRSILLLMMIFPVSMVFIIQRRKKTWAVLADRMDAEQAWVDTFGWAAHAGSRLHTLGARELAWLETRFKSESKTFVGIHQVARDRLNDSVWITRWLGAWVYVIVLVMGASKLVVSRREGSNAFKAGSFMLLLKLSLGFGGSLSKLNGSIIKLQRSAVSIQRLMGLLNIDEHKSLRDLSEEDAVIESVSTDSIELDGVSFALPKDRLGDEHLGSLRMISEAVFSVPLNNVIRVTGGDEGVMLTFMALIAGVVQPTEGSLTCPKDLRKVMLPPVTMEVPGMTVSQALQLVDADAHIAHRLARALRLDPERMTNRLAPGQLQVLTLLRTLLRDPSLLALARPFAFVVPADRERLRLLLRMWQRGGMAQILHWLEYGNADALNLPDTMPRTLVITDEDMAHDGLEPTQLSGAPDVYVDLNVVFSADVGERLRHTTSAHRMKSMVFGIPDEAVASSIPCCIAPRQLAGYGARRFPHLSSTARESSREGRYRPFLRCGD
eukprot:NODE_2847_length_2132_cov_8.618454.p1 GENE.NODE_2847_length_2132_cov_8.618454~~NODE_2847_length_2132_cov_8.618454.p1  ORF type:complete len:595 (+),score=191.84 NODE_2847_length_2132_cov_8.618454:83-1786(+)